MHSRRLSLESIMNSWVGDDVFLRVQGFRIVVIQNKQVKNKKLDNLVSNGVGLFSRLSQGNLNANYQMHKQNIDRPKSYKNQEQFVVKAKSKSPKHPNHRVSLADLGQVYSSSRNIIQNKSARKQRVSQTYNEPAKKYSSNRYTFDSQTKSDNYNSSNSKNYQPSHYERKPLGDHNYTQQKPQYQQHQYSTAPRANYYEDNENNYDRNYYRNNAQEKRKISNDDMEEIKESINGIKLPLNQSLCPEYEKANIGFQNMKADILTKIIKSGEVNQLQAILSQIRRAADEIIARHYVPAPKLQKHGIFSFNENIQQHNPTLVQPRLNKIQEQKEDKSQYVTLPQFQDEGASISSISSNNGIKNNDSKDQDFCKIQNVFINDGQNHLGGNHQQNNSDSIKLVVLDKNVADSIHDAAPIKLDFMREPKNQPNLYPEDSFRVKDTIVMSKALPEDNNKAPQISNQLKYIQKIDNKIESSLQYKPQNKVDMISSKKVQQTQIPNYGDSKATKDTAFLKKQQPYNQQINKNNQAYQLQKITTGPVKIVSNLEEAQKFDPEVVKFTELKANFIQTRTITPEIITIPSPLRFRRKQQVVKHLVAAHIVDRQSNSIQY